MTTTEFHLSLKKWISNIRPQHEIKPTYTGTDRFPDCAGCGVAVFVPSAAPLVGMLLFGNLVKEIGANTSRLADAASGPIMNTATIFLGLTVGATMTAEVFLTARTLGIVVGGFLAFAISVAGGILAVKLYNLFSRKKINPLVGATGCSAVPMASRVANEMALKYDKSNHILQYCMASNVSGVIGSAVACRRADYRFWDRSYLIHLQTTACWKRAGRWLH
jgi:oxaloacetate decarboxylase beta subunit